MGLKFHEVTYAIGNGGARIGDSVQNALVKQILTVLTGPAQASKRHILAVKRDSPKPVKFPDPFGIAVFVSAILVMVIAAEGISRNYQHNKSRDSFS